MTTSIRTGRLLSGLFIGLLAVALVGCATKRQSAFEDNDVAEGQVKGDFLRTLDQAQTHWEKRKDRAELESAIELWEEAVKMDAPSLSAEERTDKRAEAFENLARAYYFLGDSHVRLQGDDEEANEDEMMDVFEKGVTAAEQAIKLRDPKFAEKMARGEKWQDHVRKADPAAIPGLYWYGTNLGKWALLEGIATILARKDDIKETMDFICEKREDYFHGACHRYFGVYWTKVPFSKDAAKAKKHFDKTMEMSPNYLATKVLMAENYAVLAEDREMYDRLIEEVLETPADSLEGLAPENHFEKEKARRLKATADERFK
jgi:tetratricopeptide (TPR) repeat protein